MKPWTHTFHFTKNAQGWRPTYGDEALPSQPHVPLANYSGSQWNALCASLGPGYTPALLIIQIDLADATYIDHFEDHASGANCGGGPPVGSNFQIDGVIAVDGIGNSDFSADFPATLATSYVRLDYYLSTGCCGGQTVYSITLGGYGLNPFLKQLGPADCGCGVHASQDAVAVA